LKTLPKSAVITLITLIAMTIGCGKMPVESSEKESGTLVEIRKTCSGKADHFVAKDGMLPPQGGRTPYVRCLVENINLNRNVTDFEAVCSEIHGRLDKLGNCFVISY
jgi:hypothetical protein